MTKQEMLEFDAYKKDMSVYKELLSDDEMSELLKKAKAGDEESKGKLIYYNWRLVLPIAQQYQGRGVGFMDLIQQGNVGMLTAVERFELGSDVKFTTYATYWIRAAIDRIVSEEGRTIKLPVHMVDRIRNVMYAKGLLKSVLGREASIDELTDYFSGKFTASQIEDALYYVDQRCMDLQATVEGGDNSKSGGSKITFGEMISDESETPDETVERENMESVLDEAIEQLSEREKLLMKMRYGLGEYDVCTLEEIASKFIELGYTNKSGEALTKERIRQIEAECIKKLRRNKQIKDATGLTTEKVMQIEEFAKQMKNALNLIENK